MIGPVHGEIVKAVIHPGIGIARLGNSPDAFFVGPEVQGISPDPEGGYRDDLGRIKRQAARFRLFGVDARGCVAAELTPRDAEVTWRVHVANRKASWYMFELPFDIPEAATLRCARRNAHIRGADRRSLEIDAGTHALSARAPTSKREPLDGEFLGRPVALGELRVDGCGNLLVLGGAGRSEGLIEDAAVMTLANNDEWHDDVCDGPVSATARVGGRELEAQPAWVVVVPPNYAPGLRGPVTAWDVAVAAFIERHPEAAPEYPSFARHIYPILRRLVELQWVNRGFLEDFGPGGRRPFLDAEVLPRLASAAARDRKLRTSVFAQFRNPRLHVRADDALPQIYGDATSVPPSSPRQYLAVTWCQYQWLEQWAAGDFEEDWEGNLPGPTELSECTPADRARLLDQAALEDCLGGPCHPGYELPWIIRNPALYAGLARLHRARPRDAEPDYGDAMTAEIALAPGGPIGPLTPGGITRWLSVPWQGDTVGCRYGFRRRSDPPPVNPYVPSFWPARVPNQVLTHAAYTRVMDESLSAGARSEAFLWRTDWLPKLDSSQRAPFAAMRQAVDEWSQRTMITPRDGPAGAEFPAPMHVEEPPTGRN